MYRLVDDTIDVFLKAAFEVTRLFIMVLTILSVIIGGFQYGSIYSYSFSAIILSYFLSSIIMKRTNIDSRIRLAIPIIGILFSIFASLFSLGDEYLLIKVVFAIFYFVIWRKGIGLFIEKDDVDTYRMKFVTSLLTVFIIGTLVLAMGLLEWYVEFLKNYLIIYVVISGVFLSRMSIQNAYNRRNTNVLNKNKNILIFNGLSLVVILALLLIIFTDFFGIANLNAIDYMITWIGRIIGILLYPILWIGVKLFSMIKIDFSKISFLQGLSKGSSPNQVQYTEDYKNSVIVKLTDIGKWIVIAIIIAVAFYLIYRTVKGIYANRSEVLDEGEEKDFVLNLKDIKNGLKKPFISLFNNARNKFKTKSNSYVELPIMRRIYIETIVKLQNKGYIFKKSMTPNEYLNKVVYEKHDSYGFDILTEYYNGVRYGKKTISEESIIEAEEIKNRINGEE